MYFTWRHLLLGFATLLHLSLSLSLGFTLAFIVPPWSVIGLAVAYAGLAYRWRHSPRLWLLPNLALDGLAVLLLIWFIRAHAEQPWWAALQRLGP